MRFILFACFHSLLATTTVKTFLCRSGRIAESSYRIFFNIVSLFFLGWVMAAYRHSVVLYYVPGIASLVMYLLQLVLLGGLLDCLRRTGLRDFLGFPRCNDCSTKTQLLTTGYYGKIRHPLYLLSILFLLINPVMTAQWLLLTVMAVIYFIIGAKIEEVRLEKQFGDEYARYCQAVPFLIPRIPRHRRSALL